MTTLSISIALIVLGGLAYSAFLKYLAFKAPRDITSSQPLESLKELRADVNRIEFMLKIKKYPSGTPVEGVMK